MQTENGKLLNKVTVVIMQPYFLPYRNYYGLIQKADHFVVYDDVQFCRKWQQRNNILSPGGSTKWITVPIISKRPSLQLIRDVKIQHREKWQHRILTEIKHSYKQHLYFDYIYPELEEILCKNATHLVDLIVPLLQWSSLKTGMSSPKWHWASDIGGSELERTERLIHICKLLGASEYLVGPAARAYLNERLFEEVGINVLWHEDFYPDYPQMLSKTFDHYVSFLDLLMNCGQESAQYLVSRSGY